MEGAYKKAITDTWDCGETAVIAVFTPSAVSNNAPDGQCPGSPSGGEQYGTPTGTTGRELGAGQEGGGDNTETGSFDGSTVNQTSIQPE